MEKPEFEQFVMVRYVELLRTAYLLIGSQHAAEDLLQGCLLKAWLRWDTVADPLAYVRRALVNGRVSVWRRLRREHLRAEIPDRAASDDPSTVAERAAILAALAELPRRMRAVLVLRYWEDLSEKDTADLLGCSVGTVKSQASRGLVRMRQVLASSTGPPVLPSTTVRSSVGARREAK